MTQVLTFFTPGDSTAADLVIHGLDLVKAGDTVVSVQASAAGGGLTPNGGTVTNLFEAVAPTDGALVQIHGSNLTGAVLFAVLERGA